MSNPQSLRADLCHAALANLCFYDPRSLYYDDHADPEEKREPRNGCACDKCFYGKDAIALTIIAYLEGSK